LHIPRDFKRQGYNHDETSLHIEFAENKILNVSSDSQQKEKLLPIREICKKCKYGFYKKRKEKFHHYRKSSKHSLF
jgi:hypothetical protein